MRRTNRAINCSLGHVLPVTEHVRKMENERLIYAIVLILIAIFAVTIASALAKSILRLLLTVILVVILYSIFWGEGTVYISLLSQAFPERVQEEIMQGYDYYRQQQMLLPPWEWVPRQWADSIGKK